MLASSCYEGAVPASYYPGWFSSIDGFTLETVDAAIRWEQRDAPRSEAYYATVHAPYTYGRGMGERTYNPHILTFDTPKVITDVWASACDLVGCPLELLFCNRYKDQTQHLGWHADDSPTVDPKRPIVVVSFGAERFIWFRKNGDNESIEKLQLGSGSVLVMKAGMQQTHQHRIPKHGSNCGPRVSFTFRGLTP